MTGESRPVAATCFWGAFASPRPSRSPGRTSTSTPRRSRCGGRRDRDRGRPPPPRPRSRASHSPRAAGQARHPPDRGRGARLPDGVGQARPSPQSPAGREGGVGQRGPRDRGAAAGGLPRPQALARRERLLARAGPTEVARLLRHANPAITLAVYAGISDEAATAIGGKLAAGGFGA